MEIERRENGKRGEFYIEESGTQVAEMTYHLRGENEMVIEHTGVDDSLKGEGIGKDLVAAGVKFARENNLKIVPVCPFAKAEFQKNESYADVWAK